MIAPADLKLEWHEGQGRTPYHYEAMPPGNRCGWSCVWYVYYSSGRGFKIIEPRDWRGDMSTEEMRCELEDIAARGMQLGTVYGRPVNAVEMFLDYLKPDEETWRLFAQELITKARPLYKSYFAPWNPPDLKRFEMKPNERAGWVGFPIVEQEPFVPEVIKEAHKDAVFLPTIELGLEKPTRKKLK